jgi:hypothetical protein
MSEMILPGVYITVHPEGLIAPGQITIGNLGVVGTAAKGEVDTAVLLGSFDDAKKEFYEYDAWLNPATNKPNANALTLMRALEQAFAFGATTVYAVRVSTKDQSGVTNAATATITLKAAANESISLAANQRGTWGNALSIDVVILDGKAGQPLVKPYVQGEVVQLKGPNILKLSRPVDAQSSRTPQLILENNGVFTSYTVLVDKAAKAGNNQVQLTSATGKLTFPPGEAPAAGTLTASYGVNVSAQQVTIHFGSASEVYVVADVSDLVSQILSLSAWVTLPANAPLPTSVKALLAVAAPAPFKDGTDGVGAGVDYHSGLEELLNVNAHIIVAAGRDQTQIGAELEKHCAKASTDALKRDRIAVVGSALIDSNDPDNPSQANIDKSFGAFLSHNLASDRVIFVAPGMHALDSATGVEVTLPGSYAAAAVAGLISSFDPEVSPTNKELAVDELEVHFDSAHLTQMVQARILALEARSGFRIVKGITTDDGAFRQITTRRIVDYAKYGIRAAAEPYIGLLNDDRVRGALRATLNSFLTEMVNAEMLESYDLDVSATRDEEVQGIARVTMSLQPVFSIDFIVVNIFLG